MTAYKKLNQQDAYISTYTARKSWIASGSQYRELGIQNIVGLSGSGAYIPDSSDMAYGGNISNSGSFSFNKRLIFESNHHLYYSQFSSSLLTTTSSFENYLQSSYEVSGSRNLGSRVAIFSLPKEMYGTHIEPKSISIIPDFINSESQNASDNYVVNNYVTDEGVNSTSLEDNLYMENTEFIFSATGVTCTYPGTDYIDPESEYVDETTTGGGQYLDVDKKSNDCNEIVDDGEGRLYIKHSSPRYYVGNAIYPHGQLIITDEIVAMYYNHYFDAVLKWKSNLPLFTHNYHCRIKTGEYNHTLNRTALQTADGKISDLLSGSAFQPYITTVGLYNDSNDLIAVGKLGQPLPKSAETDMVIITKLDMNFGVNRFPEIKTDAEDKICTYYFTFRNFGQQIGQGTNSFMADGVSDPGYYNDRNRRSWKRDDRTYQLFHKATNHDAIDKEFTGRNNGDASYHLVKEYRGNSLHYRSRCYVDVIVRGSNTQGYSYEVLYNDNSSTYYRRPESFFINILEQYLYTNRLSCGYEYREPVPSTLPLSINIIQP